MRTVHTVPWSFCSVEVWPWLATKGPCCPSPPWGGEENGKKKAKLVGQDKGSLTEQQIKKTVTTTILVRRIHKTNSKMHTASPTTWCPACPERPELKPPPACQLPHRNPAWYQIPCSVWPVWLSPPSCVPSWLLVKVNPVLAKPRTRSKGVLSVEKLDRGSVLLEQRRNIG